MLILTAGICGENCKYMYIANIDKAHLTAFFFFSVKSMQLANDSKSQ